MPALPGVNALPLPPSIKPLLASMPTGPTMLPEMMPVARFVIESNPEELLVKPKLVVVKSPRSVTPLDPLSVPALSIVATS